MSDNKIFRTIIIGITFVWLIYALYFVGVVFVNQEYAKVMGWELAEKSLQVQHTPQPTPWPTLTPEPTPTIEPTVPPVDSKDDVVNSTSNEKKSTSNPTNSSTTKQTTKVNPDATGTTRKVPKYDYPNGVPQSADVGAGYFADAIFIGDSITYGLANYGYAPLNNVFACISITTSGMLKPTSLTGREGLGKVDVPALVAEQDPEKIYIMLGINSIPCVSLNSMVSEYGVLIDRLKDRCPGAIIYAQSIFNVTMAKESANGVWNNDKIAQYNRALMDLAVAKGVYFVNPAEALQNEYGSLSSDYSTDGVHINKAGYSKWFSYLRTHAVK